MSDKPIRACPTPEPPIEIRERSADMAASWCNGWEAGYDAAQSHSAEAVTRLREALQRISNNAEGRIWNSDCGSVDIGAFRDIKNEAKAALGDQQPVAAAPLSPVSSHAALAQEIVALRQQNAALRHAAAEAKDAIEELNVRVRGDLTEQQSNAHALLTAALEKDQL